MTVAAWALVVVGLLIVSALRDINKELRSHIANILVDIHADLAGELQAIRLNIAAVEKEMKESRRKTESVDPNSTV